MFSLNITTGQLNKISNEPGMHLFVIGGLLISQLVFWSHTVRDWCAFSAERDEYYPIEFDATDFNKIRDLIKLGWADAASVAKVLEISCN